MERTNLSALKAVCKAICNTCYVDEDVAAEMLMSHDLDPDAAPSDYPKVVSLAIRIVLGWVETSRSEGGISVNASKELVKNNIIAWCNDYGLDADELLQGNVTVISNGSNMW